MKNDITISTYCFLRQTILMKFYDPNETHEKDIGNMRKGKRWNMSQNRKYQFGFEFDIKYDFYSFFFSFSYSKVEHEIRSFISELEHRKQKQLYFCNRRKKCNKNFSESSVVPRSTSLVLNVYGHWWLYCSAFFPSLFFICGFPSFFLFCAETLEAFTVGEGENHRTRKAQGEKVKDKLLKRNHFPKLINKSREGKEI